MITRPPIVPLDESLIGKTIYVSDGCMDGRWIVGSVSSCAARVKPISWAGGFDWVAFHEDIHLTEEHKLMAMVWHAHRQFCSAIQELRDYREHNNPSPPNEQEAPKGGTCSLPPSEAKEAG
jgi:hypothetical protein